MFTVTVDTSDETDVTTVVIIQNLYFFMINDCWELFNYRV